MVLYDLPAIRSVALVGCKVVGMVLYDLPAIRSVALVCLQGSGMVLYGLPAIRSVEMLKTRQKGPLTALFVLCLCLYASTPENGLSGVLGGFVPAIC